MGLIVGPIYNHLRKFLTLAWYYTKMANPLALEYVNGEKVVADSLSSSPRFADGSNSKFSFLRPGSSLAIKL